MIESTLSKLQAEELFEKESVLFGTQNAIPEYRIFELFGESASIYLEANIKADGYFVGGKDWNSMGVCTSERPMLNYLYKSGFFKIVAENNYRICMLQHQSSEGGKFVDALWEERSRRLDELDKVTCEI